MTYVHAFVQAVFTFELKLLRFEFVALLDEVVNCLLAIDFDRLVRPVHIPKVFEHVLIKVTHNDFLVVLLQIATVNHLFDNFL